VELADHREPGQARRHQRRQADRARGRALDQLDRLLLEEAQERRQVRHRPGVVGVLGEPVLVDARQVDDPVVVEAGAGAGARPDHPEIEAGVVGFALQPAQPEGHPVDVVDRVGEDRDPRPGLGDRTHAELAGEAIRASAVAEVITVGQEVRQLEHEVLGQRRQAIGGGGELAATEGLEDPGDRGAPAGGEGVLGGGAHQFLSAGLVARVPQPRRRARRRLGLELGRHQRAQDRRTDAIAALAGLTGGVEIPGQDAVAVVGQGGAGASIAAGRGRAGAQGGGHAGAARLTAKAGVGPGDGQAAVIVAAADQGVARGAVDPRRARVTVRPGREDLRRQARDQIEQAQLVGGVARAVAHLEGAEHQEALLEVVSSQPTVDLRQRVAPEARDARAREVCGQLVDVAAQPL
jgi:hypothetical protein